MKRKLPSVVQKIVDLKSNLNHTSSETEVLSDTLQDAGNPPTQIEANPGAPSSVRTTSITTKIKLNELYDKLSKPKDIAALFRPGAGARRGVDVDISSSKLAVNMDRVSDNGLGMGEEEEDDEQIDYFKDDNEDLMMLGPPNSSSPVPHHPHDDEPFQFSFEDFSSVTDKLSELDLISSGNHKEISPNRQLHLNNSVGGNNSTKKRLNIGAIGRSVSTNTAHRDEHLKRSLLSDIGRRFSQMADDSLVDCEFKSNSLGNENRSLTGLRQSSMSVSPTPRMLCPTHQRHSTDFSVPKKRNSLLRDFSTHVSLGFLYL